MHQQGFFIKITTSQHYGTTTRLYAWLPITIKKIQRKKRTTSKGKRKEISIDIPYMINKYNTYIDQSAEGPKTSLISHLLINKYSNFSPL